MAKRRCPRDSRRSNRCASCGHWYRAKALRKISFLDCDISASRVVMTGDCPRCYTLQVAEFSFS